MGFLNNIKNDVNKRQQATDKRIEELKKIKPKSKCPRGVVQELNNMLMENEEVVYFVSGAYEKKVNVIFVTNKKIILIDNVILNKGVQQVPMESISSISKERGVLLGKIKIINNSGKEMLIENVSTSEIDIFIKKVNEQKENYKSFNIEVNKTVERDITDKIEKLSELYKEGVLTEYEFATKKMELLEKLKK